MANYIAIDCGTTNTRISIICGFKVVDTLKFSVGAGFGTEGKALLKTTVKNGISEILSKNGLCESDILRILASGMITSEFGLCALDHLTVPIGISELHKRAKEVILSDISEIPFVFIRGVKTRCNSLENADMMRGEETELMGIMTPVDGKCVYILMGSHSKIIKTDKSGKIKSFSTMLTGELLAAASKHTILKNAVSFINNDIDKEYLVKGYEFCKKGGINETLFKVRILKNIFNCSPTEVYSFFMGAILCGEVNYILNTDINKIVAGGKKQLRKAVSIILKEYSKAEVVCLQDEIVNSSVPRGLVRIYEYNGN